MHKKDYFAVHHKKGSFFILEHSQRLLFGTCFGNIDVLEFIDEIPSLDKAGLNLRHHLIIVPLLIASAEASPGSSTRIPHRDSISSWVEEGLYVGSKLASVEVSADETFGVEWFLAREYLSVAKSSIILVHPIIIRMLKLINLPKSIKIKVGLFFGY